MNITPLSKMNNQTTFGIRVINPSKFNPNTLRAVERSPLIKSIDSKYPEAAAFMKTTPKSKFLELNFGNGFKFSLSGESIDKQLKSLKLEDVESIIYNIL